MEGRFISVHHLAEESAFSSESAKPNRVFQPVILTSCWARISWGHKLSVFWLTLWMVASVKHPGAKSLDTVHTTAASARRPRLSRWFVLSHTSTFLKPLTPASSQFADSTLSPTCNTEIVLRCYKGFSVGQPNDVLCFRVRMSRRTNRGSALSILMKEMQNIWVSVLKNTLNVEYIIDNQSLRLPSHEIYYCSKVRPSFSMTLYIAYVSYSKPYIGWLKFSHRQANSPASSVRDNWWISLVYNRIVLARNN